MDNLKGTVLDIFEAACETDEVREDSDLDLFEAGLMDSLTSVAILVEIEERLGLRLQPTEIERDDMSSVNKLFTFLETRIK